VLPSMAAIDHLTGFVVQRATRSKRFSKPGESNRNFRLGCSEASYCLPQHNPARMRVASRARHDLADRGRNCIVRARWWRSGQGSRDYRWRAFGSTTVPSLAGDDDVDDIGLFSLA
jgi:hypothetical protein